MNSINKLKIVMIGPSKSGKTALANWLSEAVRADETSSAPRPTRGVRIVEFELAELDLVGVGKVDIELWDCSGDPRYESCWPAMRAGAHGVLLACAAAAPSGAAARHLQLLFNYFVAQHRLSPRQCLVLHNITERPDDGSVLNLSPTFSKVSQVTVNTATGGNRLKSDFSNYISSVIQSLNK